MDEIVKPKIHIVRTIPQCLEGLKELDPNTAITE